uniref:Uncharacterized protein n=1 Tax=Brassica oleracea var. oleracea TaxID=109376 RepID=A0A0D3CYM2_BRAOL
MRCTRGARRLRRCGLCLFVLMVSGLLSVTTLSFVGILRLAKLLVVGTLMMISFRTILPLLHPQTKQKMRCDDVWIDACVSVSVPDCVLKRGTNSIIILTLDLFTNERGVYSLIVSW